MTIQAIFARERERYVDHLIEAKTKLEPESGPVVGELLLSINNENIPYPYRYVRVDVMCRSKDGSPQPCQVTLPIDPAFEARGFKFEEITVEIYPFTWDSIQIVVDQPIPNISQLEEWIERWLDVEDKNDPGPSNTSQAIHSFSQVENLNGWWFLTGDFGSAPTDALMEIIELIAGQGVTRVVLKSGG
ncbi:hypothetical protein [Herbaspirillum chlorophenolicum]|uniref:hypothetical protein n=2 Tax=Herbaspirillum chlorophenolicum TaxID=211589 RepID=UPI0007735CAB|nr:hypothetical protein [Herbaspirillum chlorophenolicum]